VTLDFYGSGDHVKSERKAEYTERFWRKVEPRLRVAGPRAEGTR